MKRCACVLFIGLILSFAAHADGGYYPGYGYPPGYGNGYNAPICHRQCKNDPLTTK